MENNKLPKKSIDDYLEIIIDKISKSIIERNKNKNNEINEFVFIDIALDIFPADVYLCIKTIMSPCILN